MGKKDRQAEILVFTDKYSDELPDGLLEDQSADEDLNFKIKLMKLQEQV